MEPEKPWFLRFNSGDKPREPPSFLQEHSACGSLVKARWTSAATLAADPAGESPAGGNCPVATVVIPGDGEGDRSVESPEVKASCREASNSAGRSNGESVSPEIANVGSAEPVGSR